MKQPRETEPYDTGCKYLSIRIIDVLPFDDGRSTSASSIFERVQSTVKSFASSERSYTLPAKNL